MRSFVAKYGHWIALGCLVLAIIFLALPNQFIHFNDTYEYSGLEFIFHASYVNGENVMETDMWTSDARASAAGIIAFILVVLGILACIVAEKSKVTALVFGIGILIASILFFAMQGWSIVIGYMKPVGSEPAGVIRWVAYVDAVLFLIAGSIMIGEGAISLREEKAAAFTGKGYSYLNEPGRKEKEKR